MRQLAFHNFLYFIFPNFYSEIVKLDYCPDPLASELPIILEWYPKILFLPKKISIPIQNNLKMGNNIMQSQPEAEPQPMPTFKPEQEYSYISQRKANIVGGPRIVKSGITGKQLEEYIVSNPQSTVDIEVKLYKERSSTMSNNIAIVFHHRVMDEAEKLFMVRIQKMKGRLNQIQGLNLVEGLVLLQAALNGFAELVYHTKVPFAISEKMIGINENSHVRVWANENFALNKISPGINVRNENIMIHQLFSVVTDHVALEQRQAFSDFRFKIAKCQRVIQAKNMISMMLQNTNRRLVLQQLVEKQMMKMNRNSFNGGMNGINMGVAMSNLQGNNGQGQSIKIPMNSLGQDNRVPMSMNMPIAQNTVINVPQSPFSPQSPFVAYAEPFNIERIQLAPEEYTKDDEGTERIRMVRQEPRASRLNSPVSQSFQVLVKPGSKQVIEFVSQDQNMNPVLVTKNVQNIHSRHEVASSDPEHKVYKPRTANIFEIKNRSRTEENIDVGNAMSPITRSPIKVKPNIQEISANDAKLLAAAALNNKIALSENRIAQMGHKIDRLKQEMNRRTAERKISDHFNAQPHDQKQRQERVRVAVTPPHANMHKSPLNEQIRPVTRYDNGERHKTETAVGETAAKWDLKLKEMNKRTPTKPDQEVPKAFRNSEQGQALRKSMLAAGSNNKMPGGATNQFNGVYQPQQMVQINFNGNHFVSNNAFNGFGSLPENKSVMLVKNNHF